MRPSNIDTVPVAGHVLKRHGRLLHEDWEAVRRVASDAREHLIDKANFRPPKV